MKNTLFNKERFPQVTEENGIIIIEGMLIESNHKSFKEDKQSFIKVLNEVIVGIDSGKFKMVKIKLTAIQAPVKHIIYSFLFGLSSIQGAKVQWHNNKTNKDVGEFINKFNDDGVGPLGLIEIIE